MHKVGVKYILRLSTQDLLPCFEYLLSGECSFLKQEVSQLSKTPTPEANMCKGAGQGSACTSSAAVTNLPSFCVPLRWVCACHSSQPPEGAMMMAGGLLH